MTMTLDDFMKAHKALAVMEQLPADKRNIFRSFAMGYEFGIATAKNDSNAPKPTGEKTA
jgi:predicted signal transduction protein with EAL and GGDEF domain